LGRHDLHSISSDDAFRSFRGDSDSGERECGGVVDGAGEWRQSDHQLHRDAIRCIDGTDSDRRVRVAASHLGDAVRFDEWDDVHAHGGGHECGGNGCYVGGIQLRDTDRTTVGTYWGDSSGGDWECVGVVVGSVYWW
jgi:hypothetical protein